MSQLPQPVITVVVPAFNEAALIGRCLDSLDAQTLDQPFDVIVVDNGSTDRTVEVARARGVRVLREACKGVCFARQTGTLAATTPLVANLDADSYAEPDWLARLVATFEAAPDVVAVAGAVDYEDAPRWARAQAAAFNRLNALATRRRGGTAFVMASNLAFRRAAFDRVGGYDLTLPTIGDEADFLFKLRKIGRVVFVPEARVRTSARRFRRGFWHFLFVELGYQTVYAYLLGKHLHRPVRRARADIREEGVAADGPVGEVTGSRPRTRWWWLGLVLVSAGLLLALAFFLATRPRSQLYGRTVVSGRRDRRAVALTFDDGPSAPFTTEVLATLRRLGTPATFFLVGRNVERHPAVARAVAADGHIVGNHTLRHRWRDAILSARYGEAARAQAVLGRTLGVAPRFFRPPYGVHTPWQLRAVRKLGLVPVQWNVEANDPHRPGVPAIVQRILRGLRPGAIVLLHDGEGAKPVTDRSQTVAALPAIVAGIRAAGYEIVPLDELLGEPHYQSPEC